MGHVGDLGLYPRQWEYTRQEQGNECVRSCWLLRMGQGCRADVGGLGSERKDF